MAASSAKQTHNRYSHCKELMRTDSKAAGGSEALAAWPLSQSMPPSTGHRRHVLIATEFIVHAELEEDFLG